MEKNMDLRRPWPCSATAICGCIFDLSSIEQN
ncbi:uncharacterized protein G2W53_027550 [Senna tora]|uniref:Uncharacterized protein n=1 Tax=Senna tora TaxID=362788 RepID=A0A834WG52_9FABA|nr:uncharacterized protein G2W53_027550 [Senna tora]